MVWGRKQRSHKKSPGLGKSAGRERGKVAKKPRRSGRGGAGNEEVMKKAPARGKVRGM